MSRLFAGPWPCLAWAWLDPARLCGFAAPAPVLSSSGVMLISFQSDENVTFRGFQATVSFIPESGKKEEAPGPNSHPHNVLIKSHHLQQFCSRKSP